MPSENSLRAALSFRTSFFARLHSGAQNSYLCADDVTYYRRAAFASCVCVLNTLSGVCYDLYLRRWRFHSYRKLCAAREKSEQIIGQA
jgi:hypothetical protein